MFEAGNLEEYNSVKILSFEEAAKKISELKKKGKKAGLCHGGFDLLHPGHVKHFESAKKLCDVLFVSITSDRFVSQRKGDGRPVFTDRLRAYMIAALETVDYAVITDFKKGVEVINGLKPSYYIKGPDFIHKTTPGITEEREAIRSVGGEMRYTNDPKLSTTDIISYIREKLDKSKILVCVDRDGTLIEDDGFFGKDDSWKEKVTLRKDVVDLLIYIKTRHDADLVVVTNQAGVARQMYTTKRVEEIHSYIHDLLAKKGIKISSWQYCPNVDTAYAKQKEGEMTFHKDFIKEKTKRKPSPEMVHDCLKDMKKEFSDYSRIIVIGDRHEDKGLAENLRAGFVDVTGKGYEDLVREFDKQL